MTFLAEITEVKCKKILSGDREYKITLVTDNPQAIQLDEYVGTDRVVRISVEEE